jgi:hypothetical protein
LNKVLKNEKMEEKNTIEYIFNGKQVYIDNFNSETATKLKPAIEYDFIIITENENNREHKYKNKRIIKKLEEWDNSFEESNIKFVLTQAILKEKETDGKEKKEEKKEEEDDSIKVEFKTDDYNFYLVNNVFDSTFIIYFLTNYYPEKFKEVNLDTQDISLSILDENVNGFNCNINNDYIYITKTNYFRKTDIITED